MSSGTKVTREWYPPAADGAQAAPLVLYNSFLDEKVPFVPAAGPNSRQITWYACGPTVYDVAHMGHARNYLSFDIVRRVLEDYFGYNCLMVMNVTDVDDKIILRARRNYLLAQYKGSGKSPDEVKAYAARAIQAAISKQQGKVAELQDLVSKAEAELQAVAGDDKKVAFAQRKLSELEGAVRGEALKGKQAADALAALEAFQQTGGPDAIDALLALGGDYVAEALDKELGAAVTDPSVFRAHAAKYEREFLEDMDALGCRRPDVMTRVSEYIPEIIAYVQRILDNEMSYVCNGSVYFDTQNFRSCGHTYGKLNPWAVGSAALAAEGESNFETSEKRSPQDFVLWKAAKPGEPVWESPWGLGRPGWHIECSAMASSIIGSRLDIHTGGEDLRFPHHDNELAQAEAYYHTDGCKQWVNYFLHCGHLHIEGLKMSKSLKNFVTIREALQTFNARQLRLMFVLQPWNKTMLYGEQSRAEMKAREAQLKNFFQNVEAAVRGQELTATEQRWQADDFELNTRILATQAAVDAALRDNINTPAAMDALADLIKAVNKYLEKKEAGAARPLLLRKAAAYVTRILSVFGIVDGPSDRPGFTESSASAAGADDMSPRCLDVFAAFRDEVRGMAKAKADPRDVAAACDRLRDQGLADLGVQLEEQQGTNGKAAWRLADPAAKLAATTARYLDALVAFRGEVTAMAAAGAEAREVLAACDRLRDHTLVDLGVRLEDRPEGKAVWKLDDPAAMREEIAARAAAAASAARKKLEGAVERKVKELEKLEGLAALPSIQEALADKFSQFDPASGEPTHDKEGKPLEGKAKDKARKDVEKAAKVREPLTKKLAEDPDALAKMRAEVEDLRKQLEALST
ncbi:hypothetical protein PLESTB_000497800 [Pleodorina starrii]|uniref:cysteine--tRNA ligase n=1 Tax=Pleodorina starrii TaxID=330485 RepID=A0A9W6BGY5_9CHLO|nr:hypothetical protein PLESTM_000369200 [Pleodorina starrii]GLC51397.1 hypothetical protein PLESTB_000497800 [Pleodorina starrii]GLC63763.1 hypothetical protein PLESTF_000071400 [Pleodorina starrii]